MHEDLLHKKIENQKDQHIHRLLRLGAGKLISISFSVANKNRLLFAGSR
jgi:hypothetical protein